MLFKRDVLDGIVAGRITVAFRRWVRPSVRAGTTLRTAAGVVRITGIAAVSQAAITSADAKQAGFPSRAKLLDSLAGRDGTLYRIDLEYEGADGRLALRTATPSGPEMDHVLRRLARLDAARSSPWTARVLALIEAHEATRAADLASRVGRETRLFKADVRKLKDIGLTESLAVGYRLSPRGKAVLRRLQSR
jgi:hypothetical protein